MPNFFQTAAVYVVAFCGVGTARSAAADCRPSPGPWVDHYSLRPTCMDGAPASGPAAVTLIRPLTSCQAAVQRALPAACDGTKYNNCAVWPGVRGATTIFVGAPHASTADTPSDGDERSELLVGQGIKVVEKLVEEIAPHCPDGVTVTLEGATVLTPLCELVANGQPPPAGLPLSHALGALAQTRLTYEARLVLTEAASQKTIDGRPVYVPIYPEDTLFSNAAVVGEAARKANVNPGVVKVGSCENPVDTAELTGFEILMRSERGASGECLNRAQFFLGMTDASVNARDKDCVDDALKTSPDAATIMLRGTAHLYKGRPMGPDAGAPTVMISQLQAKSRGRRPEYQEILRAQEGFARREKAKYCKEYWLDRDNKGCEVVLGPAMIQEINQHCRQKVTEQLARGAVM